MADRPLLVLADERDGAAQAFVARHRAEGARLLQPSDLSRPGWCHRVGDPAAAVAVVEGRAIPASALRGVVTRLAAIAPAQLPHVAEADRDYVASEMSAFLGAWLSALACPVLNRPCVPSLSGPVWRTEQWAGLALALGVPVAPLRCVLRPGWPMPAPHPPDPAWLRLDVVGRAVIGHGHPRLHAHARRLAEGAGMALLGVFFDAQDGNARFVGADRWPDLSDRSIGDAVMDCLP